MTNNQITGKSAVEFSLKTEGTPEQIIELADSLSQQRGWGIMDSLDLGDSMGVFMRAAYEDFYSGDLDFLYMGNGFFVEISIDMPLFEWNGLPE